MAVENLIKLTKEMLLHTPVKKYLYPKYGYGFTPPQLCFLCRCIEDTNVIDGAIAEVGCSDGSTTVFLNKCLDALGINKNYYAIDTFSGFVPEDIKFEVAKREKRADFYAMFRVNKKKWFDWTMQYNNINRVISVEADINKYDLKSLGPLSFVLLDVDLYRPTKTSLPTLFADLSPGGMIVIDDCTTRDQRWDGANQAYIEFMQELGQPVLIMHDKLGIVKKR